jgi:hypothetical protein
MAIAVPQKSGSGINCLNRIKISSTFDDDYFPVMPMVAMMPMPVPMMSSMLFVNFSRRANFNCVRLDRRRKKIESERQ